MGTKLCFYHVPSGNAPAQILPLAIEHNPALVNGTAPAGFWDCDVLEDEGEVRLHAVVDEIHQACAALGQ